MGTVFIKRTCTGYNCKGLYLAPKILISSNDIKVTISQKERQEADMEMLLKQQELLDLGKALQGVKIVCQ